MSLNACTNIRAYLSEKKGKITNDWKNRPIVMDWLAYDSMKDALSIMDTKVKRLRGKADGKIRDWFLSGDKNFYNTTAERYIIDYLKSKNRNLEDNFSKQGGTDGVLHCDGEEIGIEVTTINGFVSGSIFQERLCIYLKEKGYDFNKTCEISYDHERLTEEIKKEDYSALYDYIEKVGCCIIHGASDELKKLNVTWKATKRNTGRIVWEQNQAENFPITEYLTKRFISSLQEKNKSKQLSRLRKNLVFVGVDHCSPHNHLNPRIFQEMSDGIISCQLSIDYIQDYLSKNLPESVVGLCYYIYDLDQEGPFYNPLKMFWKDENVRINIKL